MFKPVVHVFVPIDKINLFPKEKQTQNSFFDYIFLPSKKDKIHCKTRAIKTLSYRWAVIDQDLRSLAEYYITKDDFKAKDSTDKASIGSKIIDLKKRLQEKRIQNKGTLGDLIKLLK